MTHGCPKNIAFPIPQPCCPGPRLRLNRRARLSPAFCFVGSSSRFLKTTQKPQRWHLQQSSPASFGSGAACFSVASGTEGIRNEIYMETLNELKRRFGVAFKRLSAETTQLRRMRANVPEHDVTA